MEGAFPTLQDHCLYHLITHLNDYSPDNSLALLPRHLRLLLLQNVAPVHLVWLERTAVATGIDTDSVWERFVQHRSDGLHSGWINDYLEHAPRDLYVSYIYQKLFTTSRCTLFVQSFGVSHYALALFLYGLSDPVVEEGVLKIAQNSPSTLVGRVKSSVFCVPNFTPKLNTFESACCTLLSYDIYPRALDLELSSHDNLVAVASSNQRPSQLEQLFACSAVTKHLYVSLNDRLADDVVTTTKILSGLGRSGGSQLSTLHLTQVAESTLLSIAPILTSPKFHFQIKKLELVLFHGSEGFVPPLVEILQHQTSLESLSLTFQRTTCGTLGHKFTASLSHLFTYADFKEMKLKGLVDFPVAGVVSAFLSSPSSNHQTLELVQQRIAIRKDHDFDLPSSEQAHQFGEKRDLIFTNLIASRFFYDWLFSMPSICLNRLTFSHCKVIADRQSKKLNLNQKLESHSDAVVTHFECKHFRIVQW